VQAVRAVLPRCWFDAEKCRAGLKALGQYQRQWDDDKKCFREAPLHNWASHGADAFRYLALAHRMQTGELEKPISTLADVTLNHLWDKPQGGALPKRI
jgi:hypothetical protein